MKSFSDDIPNISKEEVQQQREVANRTLDESAKTRELTEELNIRLKDIEVSTLRTNRYNTITVVLNAVTIGLVLVSLFLQFN